MIRIDEILRAGTWDEQPVDEVILDREERNKRRAVFTASNGDAFLLDEPSVVHLHNGDGLKLEDGRIYQVSAKDEELVEITAENAAHLVRIAWHLGNRHLPTQLMGDKLRIRRDHVIEDMVKKLGATLSPVSAPFDPEGGAYGHGQTYGHSHDHSHHEHPHS